MTFRTFTTVAAFTLVAGSGIGFAADGAAVYQSNCAKCHGDSGHADSPMAKALKAPAIAGDASIAAMSDADLIAKIKSNKKHAGLKSLTDDDFAAVATYSKQLAKGK